jgi:glutamate-1-semialdehyde 2,1-aminomutase
MAHVETGGYDQVGTFNGNPLAMAAARATVCRVLDDQAYRRIDGLQRLMVQGCDTVIRDTGLPAHVVALGAKGCLVFSSTEVRNYRDHLAVDDRYSHCHWLFQHNGGVFLPPWGKAEQWLLSVQHDEADVARFLDNFAAMAAALRDLGISRSATRSRR